MSATGSARGALAATAVACGVSVAGIYYAQPLLPALAAAFGTSPAAAAVVVTAGQLGYTAGLLLVVPLGDGRDRRRLATALLLLAAPAAALAALAPALWVLAVAVVLLGLAGTAAQVLVALTATGAGPGRRGRAVGTVMGGLTAGILLARVVSGALAEAAGWRAVYAAAAVLLAGTALLVHRALPRPAPPPAAAAAPVRYRSLLAGPLLLLLREPALRLRCAHGFLAFAAFSAFWTSCASLLAAPPFGFGEAATGLFGLAGLAGVVFAQPAGRLCDRGYARRASSGSTALMAVSFAVLALGRGSLVALAAGAVLLDLGLRGVQTANQQQIYARLPTAAHSRVTTAYMTCYFAGGATGSVLSADLYGHAGWSGVCLLGAALAGAPLVPRILKIITARSAGATTFRPTEPATRAAPAEPEEAP